MLNSYKDLIVWQKAFDLSLMIYKITNNFPRCELYGLISQMRRNGVSIPSNIAEGYTRNNRREYIQFLYIAYASGAEFETQLLIAKALGYLNEEEFQRVNALLEEVMRMLNRLIFSLKQGII